MKKELNLKFPFWQWGGLGFYNCYASVYLCMQGLAGDGRQNCSDSLNNIFLTISGQWTTRESWSGERTMSLTASDELIDFIFGFTGYEYEKISENLKQSVVESIDNGKPLIAKLKNDGWQTDLAKGYRVITGYDGDALLGPDYAPAANLERQPEYDEIECLYVFGDKVPQKYTFRDFLKIIEKAMDSDFAEGIWRGFIKKFDYEGEKLWEVKSSEIKNRFKRLYDVMDWIPNIGHGLQTAFGDKNLLAALGADANQLGEMREVIGYQTDLLHSRGYMLTAISDCALALSTNDDAEWPWDKHGLITAARQILESIMDCDTQILAALKKAAH